MDRLEEMARRAVDDVLEAAPQGESIDELNAATDVLTRFARAYAALRLREMAEEFDRSDWHVTSNVKQARAILAERLRLAADEEGGRDGS